MIGASVSESPIIVIMKGIREFNKYSAVSNMRDSLRMLRRAWFGGWYIHTSFNSYFFSFYTIHYLILFCLGKLFYLSCAWVSLILNHCYICGCVDIVVHIIPTFVVIFLHNLYILLLDCTLIWEIFHIFPVYDLLFQCVVIIIDLHSCYLINAHF